MNQSTLVENVLRILAGFAKSVFEDLWSLFSGADGGSLLAWLSDYWKRLLLILVGIAIVIDWVVWLARWRPYWAWFGKKRILLDDDLLPENQPLPRRRRNDPPAPETLPSSPRDRARSSTFVPRRTSEAATAPRRRAPRR